MLSKWRQPFLFIFGGAGLGLIFLIFFSLVLVVRVMIGVFITAILLFGVYSYRKRWKKQLWESLIENQVQEQVKLIKTLKHFRHDMLNHFQVLLCYFKLDRTQMGQNYINKVYEEIKVESEYFRLGYEPLIAYFLSFNAIHNELQLEVNLDGKIDLNQLPVNPQEVYERITSMIEIYDKHSIYKIGEPNRVHLGMNWDKDKLYLTFEYLGELNVRELKNDIISITQEIENDSETYIEDQHQYVIEVSSMHAS